MQFVKTGAKYDAPAIAHIQKECGISALLAQALFNRGLVEPAKINAFLHPTLAHLHDPFLLPDIHDAVARIQRAIAHEERICVYGDYDADGVCATAILFTFLQRKSTNVCYHLPSRQQHGYGMHEDTVHALAEDGVKLIITVDNGITAVGEIALCSALGIDVIVTDHHQCPEVLPSCVALIDTHRADSAYPYSMLCGAGVALKLVQAMAGQGALIEYLALAALATVADIVPLTGENRAIVALGLPYVDKHIGLNALLLASGTGTDRITSETLAFRLAPRINAAGRMGEATRALELLMERDIQRAQSFAVLLNDENERRQKEEQRILREAKCMLEGEDVAALRAILLYSEDWNPGVIGIVASKLVECYYRPVLLFHLQSGELTGSCRSIPGVHMFQCLQACEGRLKRFGGHAQAAGLTLALGEFDAFKRDFLLYLGEWIPAENYARRIEYEIDMDFDWLNAKTVEELMQLAPYGEANREPLFRTQDVRLLDVQRMGAMQNHLRAIAQKGKTQLPLVAFGRGDMADLWREPLDVLYTANINTFMNISKLQLQLYAAKYEPFFMNPAYIHERHKNFYDAFFYNIIYNVSRITLSASFTGDDEIAGVIKSNIAGVLIICMTPQGAERLRAMLLEHDLADRMRVCTGALPDGINSAHTVLLAPDMRVMQYGSYTHVFFYDIYSLQECGVQVPSAPENVRLHACMVDYGFFSPLRLSRDTMGEYYRLFCGRLQTGSMKKDALVHGIVPYAQGLLALLVFIELGFFVWNGKDGCVALAQGAAKRDLMESRLYEAANR